MLQNKLTSHQLRNNLFLQFVYDPHTSTTTNPLLLSYCGCILSMGDVLFTHMFSSLLLATSWGKPRPCLSWLPCLCDGLSGSERGWSEGGWIWASRQTFQPADRWLDTETLNCTTYTNYCSTCGALPFHLFSLFTYLLFYSLLYFSPLTCRISWNQLFLRMLSAFWKLMMKNELQSLKMKVSHWQVSSRLPGGRPVRAFPRHRRRNRGNPVRSIDWPPSWACLPTVTLTWGSRMSWR